MQHKGRRETDTPGMDRLFLLPPLSTSRPHALPPREAPTACNAPPSSPSALHTSTRSHPFFDAPVNQQTLHPLLRECPALALRVPQTTVVLKPRRKPFPPPKAPSLWASLPAVVINCSECTVERALFSMMTHKKMASFSSTVHLYRQALPRFAACYV